MTHNDPVHVSAKSDYALRAMLTLAAADGPFRGEELARSQGLPVKFLENILVDLRKAGLVQNRRGADGGYRLARPATEITPAEVIRALDGPLAEVRGLRPETATYEGPAEHLQEVWVAVRAGLRSVLEHITLAQIVVGEFPAPVRRLIADPDAWQPH